MSGDKILIPGFETSLVIGIVSCLLVYAISLLVYFSKDIDPWTVGLSHSPKYLINKRYNLILYNIIFTVWIGGQIMIYIEGPVLDIDCEKAKQQLHHLVLYYITFICSSVCCFLQFLWPFVFYNLLNYNISLVIFISSIIFTLPSIIGGIFLFIWNYQYVGSILCIPFVLYCVYMFFISLSLIIQPKETMLY